MVTASRHSDLQISYVRFLLHLSCCNRSGIWWVSCIPPAEHQIECAHRALILTQYMHPQLWERTGVILPSPCCFSSCPALGKPRDGAGFGAKTTILAQLLAGITSLGSTSVQIKLLSNFLQSQPAITWLSFWVLRDIIMRFNNKLFQFCIPCKFCWPSRIVHGKKPQTHSFLLIKFFIFPLFLLHHECNSWEKKKKKIQRGFYFYTINLSLKEWNDKMSGEKKRCPGHHALCKSVFKVSVNSHFKEYFSLQDWNSF